MPKQLIQTDRAPQPSGAYSQGLRAGDFVFVSGQVGIDPGTGEFAGDTIEAQTAQTLANVKAILEAAGAGMDDVVKATVHLRYIELFSRFNAVYLEHFPDPKPTRTTVGSGLGNALVEIDVIAYMGDQ
jgi:2-iminobutanoate/2-iminopropanoate deaminase